MPSTTVVAMYLRHIFCALWSCAAASSTPGCCASAPRVVFLGEQNKIWDPKHGPTEDWDITVVLRTRVSTRASEKTRLPRGCWCLMHKRNRTKPKKRTHLLHRTFELIHCHFALAATLSLRLRRLVRLCLHGMQAPLSACTQTVSALCLA